MRRPVQAWILTIGMAQLLLVGCSRSHSPSFKSKSWDAKAAAAYLDQRETSWMGWPGAARDRGTFCISCHTVLPYVLSRPALRLSLAEDKPTTAESEILESVTKRVRLWKDIEPFYSDDYRAGKTRESRGTESVLNALSLAAHDAETGHLQSVTRVAFDNMWALQEVHGVATGAWPWLQFNLEPWEAKDSQYYGAALAAIAVGMAPDNYRAEPSIQTYVKSLHDYLNLEYASQSTINRAVLLWASAELPGVIDAERQKAILEELTETQQADGGWRLSSLTWPNDWNLHSFARKRLRADWTRQVSGSDGYATGLTVFALQRVGISLDDPRVRRGLQWLASNQSSDDGSWPSSSVNERRNPASNVGHFMKDAASAFAVLALSESTKVERHPAYANIGAHGKRVAPKQN